MKKIIALLLALTMVFACVSVVAYAADPTDTTPAETEQGEEYYTLLNFFQDLFERFSLLFEYIVKVFFPDYVAPSAA